MSQGILELDSYRLAQYALQMPCVICATGNAHDAVQCRLCHAPLALSRQAANTDCEPRLVAMLGPSGVGKSCYLGVLLDILSRQTDRMKFTPRGPFSLTLQQSVIASLYRGEFPTPTAVDAAQWPWVHALLQWGKRRTKEVVFADVSGESLGLELDCPNKFPAIRASVTQSAGLMIYLDAPRLAQTGRDSDYASLKLLTYLQELVTVSETGWGHRPVAFVLTKADQCENVFANPAGYVERFAPSLWRHCEEHLPRCEFFAVSIAGAVAYRVHPREGRVRFPLRIEPRGILDPWEWLIENLP